MGILKAIAQVLTKATSTINKIRKGVKQAVLRPFKGIIGEDAVDLMTNKGKLKKAVIEKVAGEDAAKKVNEVEKKVYEMKHPIKTELYKEKAEQREAEREEKRKRIAGANSAIDSLLNDLYREVFTPYAGKHLSDESMDAKMNSYDVIKNIIDRAVNKHGAERVYDMLAVWNKDFKEELKRLVNAIYDSEYNTSETSHPEEGKQKYQNMMDSLSDTLGVKEADIWFV